MRCLWALLFSATLIPVSWADEIDVTAGVESFRWEEFEEGGRSLLDETGTRNFVGVKGSGKLDGDWLVDFGGRFYSGTVDYDGETQPVVYPITTHTDYFGLLMELGFSYPVGPVEYAADSAWRLRLVLGLDQWRRSLQDTSLPTGQIVEGYDERYFSSYARGGIHFRRKGGFDIGVGAKIPFYTREKIDLGNTTLILYPKGQWSLFASVDIPINRQWGIEVAYDTYRFGRSDSVRVDSYTVWQPESHQDTLSVAFHYRF